MKKKIMPPTYLMVLLILLIGAHLIIPVKKIIFPPYSYLGWILVAIGVFLNLWVDFKFKKKGTTIKSYNLPSKFITSGAYKISRHPVYLGMLMILLGTAIILGSAISFIFPIIFVILTEYLFISTEEKNMERVFGKKYLDYKKKVRRWI